MCALLLAACLVPLGAAGQGQGATDTDLARRTHAIATDVMSPYCPGRTLADCPSPNAAAVRAELRGLLESGLSDDEARARLEQRFGDALIGTPQTLLGWALPIVALVAGLVALVFALRRLSTGGTNEPTPVDPDLEADLDRELRDHGL